MREKTAPDVARFLLEGKDPGRVALKLLSEDLTYGQLRQYVDKTAAFIAELRGRKGDRVLLVGENSSFWVAAYLGILKAGMVCVPLATGISTDDLKHILDVTGARVAFAQRGFVAREGSSLGRLHLVTDIEVLPIPGLLSQRVFSELDPDDSTLRRLPSIAPDDLAALMFTSGSTGRPRGVMISHRNIQANTESIVKCLRLTDADRMMAVLPFYYCFGTSLLHTHLRVGGSLVIDNRFMYPESVLQRMADTQCTAFAGVPSHFQILLRGSSLGKKAFPHLRYVQQAGGHLAPNFVSELRDALPETQIFIMYGQTEATARLSYLPPEFVKTKFGSVGRGIPGVRLRVVNEFGEKVQAGELGEIVASGENIARGYWCSPEESAATFRNGVLHTGDLATVDDAGFVYIVDRAKDFIKCGGERVSCRQLEEHLLEFEELIEAAVVGVPDAILGESVKAFVVPRSSDRDGLEARLASFCKKRLSAKLVPREIVVLARLPKNSAGKVLKAQLKATTGPAY